MSRAGSRMMLAVMVLATTVAHAALPPEYYRAARERAPHHLQVRVVQVTLLPGQALDNCEVEVTVLRDFRGTLEKGTPLRFALNCTAPGVQPMPGPNAWHDYGALEAAHFVEGFFRGATADIVPVYGQLAIIPEEREQPWCEARSGRCDLAADD